MTSSSLYRFSGIALFIGAVVASLGYLIKPEVGRDLALYFSPYYVPSTLLTFTGALIMLLGLPGMYSYQAGKAGAFGLITFGVAFIGLTVLEVGNGLLYAFVPPLLASNPLTQFLVNQPKGGGFEGQLGPAFLVFFLIGLLGSNLGGLFYGVATLRARIYPRWAAILLIAGVLATFALSSLHSAWIGDRPIIIMLAGFAWCGYYLWTHNDRQPYSA